MKYNIIVVDDDKTYSKKFCNQANKLVGERYNFVPFSNLKAVKEYLDINVATCAIAPESYADNLSELNISSFYLLSEVAKTLKKEGKKTYIYKLQNINKILKIVDDDIKSNNDKYLRNIESCKLILFYSPYVLKNKNEFILKVASALNKRVLIIDLDEFSNYKGGIGLSNLIFAYKENNLNEISIRREIIRIDNVDMIKSVTYPEDFNVINNIDLDNIINEITKLDYDYIFINSDTSYIKSQYIFNDADKYIVCMEKEKDKIDIFEKYLKSENAVDYKKIVNVDILKASKSYLSAFINQCFGDTYDRT